MQECSESIVQQNSEICDDSRRLITFLNALLPALFGSAESVLEEVAQERQMKPFDYAQSEWHMSIPILLKHFIFPYALRAVAEYQADSPNVIIPFVDLHTSIRNMVQKNIGQQEEGGVTDDHVDIAIPDAAYSILETMLEQEMNKRLLRLSAEMRMPMHAPVNPNELRFIRNCTVRSMGEVWNGGQFISGGEEALERDVAIFRKIEWVLTAWRRKIEEAIQADPNCPNPEMLPGVQEGIHMFEKEGGHINQLSKEQIIAMHTKGLVTMLVHQLEGGGEVVVGTVSSLFGAPKQKTGPFAQLSVRTLALDQPSVDKWVSEADRTLLICRSSVLPSINKDSLQGQKDAPLALQGYDQMSLHRLGLAALGKLAHVRTAQSQDLMNILFRIGRIESATDTRLRRLNMPSALHNIRWSKECAGSTYTDQIPIANAILLVTWQWFCGEVAQAFSELTRFGGILEGKGWNMRKILEAADRIAGVHRQKQNENVDNHR